MRVEGLGRHKPFFILLFKHIIVIEKRYVNSGSSTGNVAHFRVHFGSEENTKFVIEFRKLMLKLAKETEWNTVFDVFGYPWLLKSEEQVLYSFSRSFTHIE